MLNGGPVHRTHAWHMRIAGKYTVCGIEVAICVLASQKPLVNSHNFRMVSTFKCGGEPKRCYDGKYSRSALASWNNSILRLPQITRLWMWPGTMPLRSLKKVQQRREELIRGNACQALRQTLRRLRIPEDPGQSLRISVVRQRSNSASGFRRGASTPTP